MKSGRPSIRVTAQASRKVLGQMGQDPYRFRPRPRWYEDPNYVREPTGKFTRQYFDPEDYPDSPKRPQRVGPGGRPQAPQAVAPEGYSSGGDFDFVEALRRSRGRGFELGSDWGLGFEAPSGAFEESISQERLRSRPYPRSHGYRPRDPAVGTPKARVDEIIPSIQDVKAPLSEQSLDQLEGQVRQKIEQIRTQIPAEEQDTPAVKALVQRLWLVYDIALLRYHYAKNPTPALEQRIKAKEQEMAQLSTSAPQPPSEVVPSTKRAPVFEEAATPPQAAVPAPAEAPVTEVGTQPQPKIFAQIQSNLQTSYAAQIRHRARQAKRKGNTGTAEALEELAVNVENGKVPFESVVVGTLKDEYQKLRMPADARYFKDPEVATFYDIDTITRADSELVKVTDKNGWHYRTPVNGAKPGSVKERYSLNVRGTPELIKALDEFVSNVGAYYKTPEDGASWGSRHDPVTVYADAGLSRGAKSTLASIAAPYVRSDAPMPGIRIADGVYREVSPSRQDIADIFARAGALGLRPYIENWIGPQESRVHISTGQRTVLNAFLDNVEQSVGVSSTLARPPPLPSKVVPTSTRAPAFDTPMEEPAKAPSTASDIPMEEPVEAPAPAAESKQVGPPKREREPNILVIDPEGTLDSRLFEAIKNQDMRTTWPGTLSEIGGILQSDPPAGIVLAAGLGGVSPQQVIGALRPYIGGQAPIIVLGSGKPNQEIHSIQQAVAAGASHFFSLPTNNAYVAFKLRRMMDAAAPTVEAPEAAEPSDVAGLAEVEAPVGPGPSVPEAVEDEPLELAPEEVEEVAESPASAEPGPAAKVHTVLIVDPKQTLGKNISESFKAQGLKTVVVADPDEVGNAITGTQAHAVIVATDLGGESAEQAIKVIRANPRGSVLPVFLAGTGGKNQRIRSPRDARRVGADFMFSLPSHIPYVARQVKKWVTKGSSIPPDEAEEKPKVTPDEIAEIQRAIDVLTTRAAQLIKKAMKARKEGRKDEANRIFAKVREQSAQISQFEEELARLTAAAESADEPEKLEFLQPPSESGSTQYMFTDPRSGIITRKRRKREQR